MDSVVDVVIIGSGPAGLQAAIHASRRKAKVVLIGKSSDSAILKADIENYLGISEISGQNLLDIGLEQVKNFGTEVLVEEATALEKTDVGFSISTDTGKINPFQNNCSCCRRFS